VTVSILRGDARNIPLADNSVDLVVTSPPYFQLRSYRDGGEHYETQIGAEATPAEYIDALIDCTREWMRVLKPTGSIFVNLGDKYASSGGHTASGGSSVLADDQKDARNLGTTRVPAGSRSKSLLFLPERYRIAATDRLGLIGRAVICWSKPNGLPESVTDRVRRSHEDWVHLTKQPRYFSAVDEIRESAGQVKPGGRWQGGVAQGESRTVNPASTLGSSHPLGKLPGSVWEVATQPLTVPAELGVDHFAAFPLEWPRRLIRGWSPSGICTACGEGRRPVADRASTERHNGGRHAISRTNMDNNQGTGPTTLSIRPDYRITGYACACPDATAPTRPATVLDPFSGTGTTILVADVLGRHGIGIDASADYNRIAAWRTTDPRERARALGVSPPPARLAGEVPLFDLADGSRP